MDISNPLSSLGLVGGKRGKTFRKKRSRSNKTAKKPVVTHKKIEKIPLFLHKRHHLRHL
jgi:hypothetical protein